MTRQNGQVGRDWTPPLQVQETASGCRLVLAGLTYGSGATLQEAADNLVMRLLNLALAVRSPGFRIPSELGPPDPRMLNYLWDIAERAARGESIRHRVIGLADEPDPAA